jgi:hypothetical protein
MKALVIKAFGEPEVFDQQEVTGTRLANKLKRVVFAENSF